MMRLPKCLICNKNEAFAPKGKEKYCKECWDRRNEALDIERKKFESDRYLRTESAEIYFLRHEEAEKYPSACGHVTIVEDKKSKNLQAVCVLFPTLDWERICYKDTIEEVPINNIVVDVISELVESWGGGKWNLEIYYSTNEGESWSGEI